MSIVQPQTLGGDSAWHRLTKMCVGSKPGFRYPLGLLLTAAAVFGPCCTAAAVTYRYTDLGTLGGGLSWGNGINNAGQVVGTASTGSGLSAAIWHGGKVTRLPMTLGDAINEAGQVAGLFYHPSSLGLNQPAVWTPPPPRPRLIYLKKPAERFAYVHDLNDAQQAVGRTGIGWDSVATIWNGTTPTYLATGGVAYAINNAGQVVGEGTHGNPIAIVWNGTTPTELRGPSDSLESRVLDINDAGQVVGWSYFTGSNGSGWYATLWNGTTPTELGTLGYARARALAINESGQIVGWAEAAGATGTEYHATLWTGTIATDLNVYLDAGTAADWALTEATDINDNGWITGTAYNRKTGLEHAFLLAVIPEPGTYSLLLAGLGVLVCAIPRQGSKSPSGSDASRNAQRC